MKFVVITHVPHIPFGDTYQAYSAYVREMNVWASYVDEICLVAPQSNDRPTAIHLPYKHAKIRFYKIPSMGFTSLAYSIKTLVSLPIILFKLFRAMRKADHIHLRCPGTIGLMGCLVQILFPKKPKTAKYAGNWDPKAEQPLSYRLQKKILSSTFLTKNMQVLVYGNWKGQSKNIHPFFTASYPISKLNEAAERNITSPYKAIFVGTLSPGKRPVYAMQLVAGLRKQGINIQLDYYGEGVERTALETSINVNGLASVITLHGNQTSQVLEEAYQNSDFLILPSKSEGWPKVVAEAMFWGCVPIVTSISCVPWMIDNGNRGMLISLNLEKDIQAIMQRINADELNNMSKKSQEWSHEYTIDSFKAEIKKLVN